MFKRFWSWLGSLFSAKTPEIQVPSTPELVVDIPVDVPTLPVGNVGITEIGKIPNRGDKGLDVKTLQQALNANGAALIVDGDFGMATEKAISAFQKKNGMAGSGVLGPKTIKLLGLTIKVSEPTPVVGDLSKLQEGTLPWYKLAWQQMVFMKAYEAAILSNTKLVLKGKSRYETVEKATGVPWWIIGAIHFKEASCNFAGVLHNGERIIGTGKKTTIVPAGRGPFTTWEEAAIDAITLNGGRWSKIKAGNLNIAEVLYAVERYNGTGYISGAGKAETSPYLWARTSINDGKGKYVSDGKFDPNASTLSTSGFAAIVKQLEILGEIKVQV